eukprot:gene22266-27229_t
MEKADGDASKSTKSNQSKGPYKGPKSRGGASEKGEKSSRPRGPSNPPRVKIVIRRLPATKDYTLEEFQKALDGVLSALCIEKSACNFEHFIPGKISRKRGPITSAGFLSLPPQHSATFLEKVGKTVPFLPEEEQPEVLEAPFKKLPKQKDKVDKLMNTYESDPLFQQFQQTLSNPTTQSAPAAPATAPSTAASIAEKLKTNPLLAYLREKYAKRERGKGGADAARRSGGAKEDKKRGGGRGDKEKKKKKDEKAAGGNSNVAEDGKPAGEGGEGKKKKKSRREKRKKEPSSASTASPAGGPAANASSLPPAPSSIPSPVAPPAAPPKKMTILRREPAPAPATATVPAATDGRNSSRDNRDGRDAIRDNKGSRDAAGAGGGRGGRGGGGPGGQHRRGDGGRGTGRKSNASANDPTSS